MKKIIKDEYYSDYKVEKRGSYLETKFGFSGVYIHPLSLVDVDVCQDCKENYYLIMNIVYNKRRWNRQIEFTQKPTQRYVSTLARRFVEGLLPDN